MGVIPERVASELGGIIYIVVPESSRKSQMRQPSPPSPVPFSSPYGNSITGRTSTVPLRAIGILVATATASSEFFASMRK